MKFSIITVCRNAAQNIRGCIQSVASQEGITLEHLIIDGVSTDQTLAVIQSNLRPDVRLISEPDNGIYDAMNKGIKLAAGEIIGMLNADDYYSSPDVLLQVQELFEDPDLDSCYADLDYVDVKDDRRVVRAWRSQPFKKGLFRQGWMPAHPTFFVRRSVYERLGGFDPQFKLAADFELTMRFLEIAGIQTRYVPKVWIKMRMGGATNGTLRNILQGNWESYLACRKNGLRVTPFFMVRKVLSRIPQFFQKRPSTD